MAGDQVTVMCSLHTVGSEVGEPVDNLAWDEECGGAPG